MNGKDILLGMSFISDELVEEADSQTIRKALLWKKWLPLAACVCLVVGAAALLGPLIPGLDNAMPESVYFDAELSANCQQNTAESGQEYSGTVIWNSASSGTPVLPADEETNTVYSNSLPQSSGNLQLYTEKSGFFLYRMTYLIAENRMYIPDSTYSTWIRGTAVQLFSADNGTLLARFVIPCGEAEYLQVTAYSNSLSEDAFVQAITKLIEDPEVIS